MSDAALFERVRSILINAAEGQRSVADDREYKELRTQLRKRDLVVPALVLTHPTVDSFMASMKGIRDRKERVERVRREFTELPPDSDLPTEIHQSVGWTGKPDRIVRLKVVREILPLAQSTIETMIDALSQPGPNGGPLLDETEDALRHLRELHRTLGELLKAMDGGQFDDELGQGLAADAVRLASNVRDTLRDEPLPYAVSGLIFGIFTAVGMPAVGGFLSERTFNLTRKRKDKGRP